MSRNTSKQVKSYERQGIEQIPTVHMGPAVAAMERKGVCTDIGNLNRDIRKTNKMLTAMKRAITGLMSWLREVKTAIAEIEAKPEEIYLADLLIRRFDERNAERREWVSRSGKLKAAVKDMQRVADITAYLKEHGILTVVDLEAHMEEIRSAALPLKEKIKKAESRITQIGKIHQYAEKYNRTDVIHARYLKIHWKGSRQKFAQAHKAELDE